MIDRRSLLKSALCLAAAQAASADLAAAAPAAGAAIAGSGPPQAFDYAWLKGQARFLANNAFQDVKESLPPAMLSLSYDQYQSIRFRPDHSLWGDSGLALRLQFFHVGRTFTAPVPGAAAAWVTRPAASARAVFKIERRAIIRV